MVAMSRPPVRWAQDERNQVYHNSFVESSRNSLAIDHRLRRQ
jgi:hypothetical protein